MIFFCQKQPNPFCTEKDQSKIEGILDKDLASVRMSRLKDKERPRSKEIGTENYLQWDPGRTLRLEQVREGLL